MATRTAAALLTATAILASCGQSDHHTTVDASYVIDTCQEAVKKILKDPDSAKFSDWTAREVAFTPTTPAVTYDASRGDSLYNAAGMVNSKNSFGGYTGSKPYKCDAVITRAGDISARAIPPKG